MAKKNEKKNWDNYLNDYQTEPFMLKKKERHVVEERVSYFAIILFCLASLDLGRKSKANAKKGLRNSISYFMKSCPLRVISSARL